MMSKKFYLRGGSFLCLMLCLVCWMFPAGAEEPDGFFDRVEADSIGKIFRNYDSPTLKYTAESFTMDHAKCYLVRLWVKEPERQIRKATADWKKNRQYPVNMAKQIPDAGKCGRKGAACWRWNWGGSGCGLCRDPGRWYL